MPIAASSSLARISCSRTPVTPYTCGPIEHGSVRDNHGDADEHHHEPRRLASILTLSDIMGRTKTGQC